MFKSIDKYCLGRQQVAHRFWNSAMQFTVIPEKCTNSFTNTITHISCLLSAHQDDGETLKIRLVQQP